MTSVKFKNWTFEIHWIHQNKVLPRIIFKNFILFLWFLAFLVKCYTLNIPMEKVCWFFLRFLEKRYTHTGIFFPLRVDFFPDLLILLWTSPLGIIKTLPWSLNQLRFCLVQIFRGDSWKTFIMTLISQGSFVHSPVY